MQNSKKNRIRFCLALTRSKNLLSKTSCYQYPVTYWFCPQVQKKVNLQVLYLAFHMAAHMAVWKCADLMEHYVFQTNNRKRSDVSTGVKAQILTSPPVRWLHLAEHGSEGHRAIGCFWKYFQWLFLGVITCNSFRNNVLLKILYLNLKLIH